MVRKEYNMNLYQIDKLKKVYGDKVIFDNVSLSIEHDDKIGIIGINGAGKTTLLNIITERDSADNIEVIKTGKIRIEYLPQNPEISEELTVLQQIFKSESPVVKLVGEYEEIVSRLERDPQDDSLQKEMTLIAQKMDINDAWGLESEAKKILTKLKITDFDKKMKELSGGQRKRVAMAGALIRPSDILILDEPTNHIDNDTIDFLEEYLKSIRTSLIMVTHDRYFLDRVTNTIVELEAGKLYKHKGNYSKYLEIKQQRMSDMERIEEKKQRLYKKELEWIRKGVEARRTKQKARKDRFEDLEKNLDRTEKEDLDIDVATTRLGSKIIEAYDLCMAYPDKDLFKDFTYTINRTDRIGITGRNGMGKTTLLNILAGIQKPVSGTLEFGETVKIGYYTQENLDMNTELRAIDYIRETAEYITKKDGSKVSASQMMENFLFNANAQHTFIRKLSGGERRRLYLLKILMDSPNVIFLDEPTNDLDIETLTVLEEYINYFDGPVITVSHDRYFLDKICNRIFSFEDDGEILYTIGNYQDYYDRKKDMYISDLSDSKRKNAENAQAKDIDDEKTSESRKAKLTYNEKREYDRIPQDIEILERKLEGVSNELSKAGSDFVRLQTLTAEQENIETELLEKMERLEYLEKIFEISQKGYE